MGGSWWTLLSSSWIPADSLLDPPSSDEEEREGSGSSWSEGGDAAPVAVADVTSVDVGVVLRPRNVEVSKHIMVVRTWDALSHITHL